MPETNELLRLLPLLKGIPAACLLALLLMGPLDLGGLTQATGYTRGKVLGALGMLETLGLVGLEPQGWIALKHKFEICATDSRVLESKSLESLSLESESLDSETQTQDSDSESVLKILNLAQDLFGEPVLLPPGLEIDPHILLCLLAEAYANRHRLRKPARVVAANLREGRQPSRKFLLDPQSYLPTDFIRKLYQAYPVSAPENKRDTSEAAAEEFPREDRSAHGQDWEAGGEGDTGPDAQEACELAPEARESERLWRAARDELQRSLPKASYESYVQPLAALDYDPEQRQLFLEAPDGPSCRWLDGHLKRILERLMVGITGEAVEVVFLPPEESGAGGEA